MMRANVIDAALNSINIRNDVLTFKFRVIIIFKKRGCPETL